MVNTENKDTTDIIYSDTEKANNRKNKEKKRTKNMKNAPTGLST